MKTVIFIIQGGIGKHIAATAVIENIKKNFPDRKLIVLAHYPEILINNPLIHRVYRANALQYFYEDYIKGKDAIILSQEVYQSTEYIIQEKHLIQAWCECLNLKYDNENPNIFLNQAEVMDAKYKYYRDKPILLIQSSGGAIDNQNYSWARDIPPFLVQEIINELKNKYHIYVIKKPNQLSFNGAESLHFNNLREAIALLHISEKRLLIDSFLQHAAGALRLPSVVCWIGTRPSKLGYNIHKNICPSQDSIIFSHMLDSTLIDKEFVGVPHQCNFDLNKIFNKSEILDAILS